MSETLSAIMLALGTGFTGAFSGWFFGRKRQNIENIDMALETWQKVVDSLEKRVGILLEKVDALTLENERLKNEVSNLRDELLASNKKDKKIEQLERKIIRYERLLADNGIEF